MTTQSLFETIVCLTRAKYFEKVEPVDTASCNYNSLASPSIPLSRVIDGSKKLQLMGALHLFCFW